MQFGSFYAIYYVITLYTRAFSSFFYLLERRASINT